MSKTWLQIYFLLLWNFGLILMGATAPMTESNTTINATNNRNDGKDSTSAVPALKFVETNLSNENGIAVTPEPPSPDLPDDDFNPGLLVFVLFLLGLFLVEFITFLLLGSFCVIATIFLIAAGMISTSVFIGYLHRSVATGFRILIIQLGAALGFATGLLAAPLFIWLKHAKQRWILYESTGAFLGLALGIALAWLIIIIWQAIARRLSSKWQN